MCYLEHIVCFPALDSAFLRYWTVFGLIFVFVYSNLKWYTRLFWFSCVIKIASYDMSHGTCLLGTQQVLSPDRSGRRDSWCAPLLGLNSEDWTSRPPGATMTHCRTVRRTTEQRAVSWSRQDADLTLHCLLHPSLVHIGPKLGKPNKH